MKIVQLSDKDVKQEGEWQAVFKLEYPEYIELHDIYKWLQTYCQNHFIITEDKLLILCGGRKLKLDTEDDGFQIIKIKFKDKNDAVQFKLRWIGC